MAPQRPEELFDLLPEAGCAVVEVPLLGGIEEGWSLDLDGIDAAFDAGARAMLLCNPHNPVARRNGSRRRSFSQGRLLPAVLTVVGRREPALLVYRVPTARVTEAIWRFSRFGVAATRPS